MRKIILFVLVFVSSFCFSQNTFTTVVQDNSNKQILASVSVQLKGTTKGTTSNAKGEVVLNNIPNGKQTIVFSYIGYQVYSVELIFPLEKEIPVIFLKHKEEEKIEEVVVEGTRSNRSIAKIPTRVEVLTEEIDEAATMDPSKVAHLLTHSTGIQVQQTSATTNTANVRVQGLDGRYTQILKDGFPLFGGFSGSLSIMQIPPLDLRQVEYIKGGASTLYGGGAISGLINIISKEPKSNETILHINQSQIGAFDVNMFTSRRYDKIGFTLLAQRNYHKLFDADKDGFSDMPQLTKYNFNPKVVFYISDKTILTVASTFTQEKKQGGDTKLINNESATSTNFYSEKNDISRTTTQIKFEHKLSNNQFLTFRNSFNFFDRNLSITPSFALGEYKFAGNQTSSFSEFSFTNRKDKNVFISGINFYSDDFKEKPLQATTLRNENIQTLGGFANYTFDASKKVSIESGLRMDYVLNDKVYILPRISVLLKWNSKLTTRIGGGMGYRNASIFNQEAELLGYKNVVAIDRKNTTAEQSYGGNADIGYKAPLGHKTFIQFNQMVFYTYLKNPLILTNNGSNFNFINATGYTESKGFETTVKIGVHDFTFFVGYTYTDANNFFNNTKQVVALTPKHSIKGDLLYSIPGKWRIGADYEFKSSQTLSNGNTTPSFWTFGALVERTFDNYTFFINTENMSDYRQTTNNSLISAPYNTPQFTEVWAPLDGFVINWGMKIKM